jgi:hypothetical protein
MGFIDAVDEGEWRRAWIWFAIALSLREDVGLQGAAVALTLLAFPQRPGDRLQALILTVVGLGWFFGYVLYLQPRFLPPVGSYDLHFARFAGEGGGAAGVLRAAARDPAALGHYLVSEGRPLYLVWLILPVACLPLAAPRWLAGAAPLVAINLLSDVPGVRAIQAHYITAAAPFLVGAALIGCWRVAPILGRAAPFMLLVASAAAFVYRGATPASPEWRWEAYRDDDFARRARALVKVVPADAQIAAPSRLAAHLAERKVVRRIP